MGTQQLNEHDNTINYPDLGAPERAKERRRYRRDKRNFWIVRLIVWTLLLGSFYAMGYLYSLHNTPRQAARQAVPIHREMPDKEIYYSPAPKHFHNKGKFI